METFPHRRTRVRNGSHLLGLTPGEENNPAEDPVGFKTCENVQHAAVPDGAQTGPPGRMALRRLDFWVPGICCANSGMTTP